MAPKSQFDTRRPADVGTKHRDLFSPYCKFCGDPIEWAEFRFEEETKTLPVTPHTFEDHRPICRKQHFKPRKVYTNPNAGSSYAALQKLENERLKLKINELESTADLNERRIRELTNRLEEQTGLNGKDDVGSSDLREAIKTMGNMSVHVRDLAKSVQIILKNSGIALPKSMAEQIAPVQAAAAPQPAAQAAPAPATAPDLHAHRLTEIEEQKTKLYDRINAGENQYKAASELGINAGVASSWIDEGRKNGRIARVTIDTVKLEKTKGGRYTGEQKREILRAVLAGLSRPEINQKFGCTAITLVNIVEEAKKAGLDVKITRKYVKRGQDVKEAVLADLKAGKSVTAIAKERGIPNVTIELWSGRKKQLSRPVGTVALAA